MEELFLLATELPRGDREAFLDRHCGADLALRQELAKMLEEDDRGTKDFLRSPTRIPPSDAESATPDFLGRHRILKLIAEGGMGQVFLAQQEHPVRRRVALKILKLGLIGAEAATRFESERQVLAMMDHPGIARIFDGGTTENGRPWFAMEYVEGLPIDEYCRKAGLSVRDRLTLFLQVCDAVQHAHVKGVLHRDLKASNLLVATRDGVGVPVVIDFGIACGLQEAADSSLSPAEVGHALGSLASMSPEQIRGEALDARSDVYSLGSLLFELLTGTAPIEWNKASGQTLGELADWRDDQQIPPASRRCEPASKGTFRGMARQLEGDLDAILARALQRDRELRYSTPSELAADIRRHLDGYPVLALPPTPGYLLGRMIRRHRRMVLAAGLAIAGLVCGTVFAFWGMVRAVEQAKLAREREAEAHEARAQAFNALTAAETAKEQARQESLEARALADYLDETLSLADPQVSFRSDLDAQGLLRWAAQNVGEGLAEHPEGEARVRRTLGRALYSLGNFSEADRHLRRALAIEEQQPEVNRRNRYETLRALARVHHDSGKLGGVGIRYRTGLLGAEIVSQFSPEASLSLLEMWSLCDTDPVGLRQRGSELIQGVSKSVEDQPASWDLVADVYEDLAYYLVEVLGEIHGVVFLDETLRLRRETHDPRSPDLARVLIDAARVSLDLGRNRVAREWVREALDINESSLASGHWRIAQARSLWGLCLTLDGQVGAGLDLLAKTHQELRDSVGPFAPAAIHAAVRHWKSVLAHQGPSAARPLGNEVLHAMAFAPDFTLAWKGTRELLVVDSGCLENPSSPLDLLLTTSSGMVWDRPEAFSVAATGVTQCLRALPAADDRALLMARLLAASLIYAGEEVVPAIEELAEALCDVLLLREEQMPASAADAHALMARVQTWRGEADAAMDSCHRALELYAVAPGDQSLPTWNTQLVEAECLWQLDDRDSAIQTAQNVWDRSWEELGPDQILTVYAFIMMAEYMQEQGRWQELADHSLRHLEYSLQVGSAEQWVDLANEVVGSPEIDPQHPAKSVAADLLARHSR